MLCGHMAGASCPIVTMTGGAWVTLCSHQELMSLGFGMNGQEQSVVVSSAAQSFCPSKGSCWVQPEGAGRDLCLSPV